MASPLRTLASWDRRLFLEGIGLAGFGAVAMASAAATVNPALAIRHLTWILLGILISVGVAQTNYRQWLEVAVALYAIEIIALGIVPIVGATRLGATRWLSVFGLSIQPAELAKLGTILVLARYLAGQPVPLPPRAFWGSLAIVAVPAVLIFLQPDLGSASLLGAIWLGMVMAAGASQRMLTLLGLAGAAGMPMAWHVLKDYQRDRLFAFINPHADPLGTGYTIIQSTIAIGSGRMWGRGWFAGTQNQLSFLPERHSDFIFSVIGEEWGLLGCLLVIGLFGLLLGRMGRLAQRSSDPRGRLLATGVFSWVGYQAIVNMGMVSGLLPVVGVPLPLLSYGGSSMVTVWIALGLLQGVHRADAVP